MSNMKRTLSTLLAIVMVMTTMSVAFTAIGASQPPYAARTQTANPAITTFTVPQYLEAFGTNRFERGNTIAGGKNIFLQVSGATDVSLSCDQPGVSFTQTNQVAGQSTTWTIGDGGSITTGSTSVKWTVRFKIGTKYYTANAWSAIKNVYNDPGFATHFTKGGLFHDSKNDHVEWITPVYGNYVGATGFNCYIDKDSGGKVDVTGAIASAWYQSGSGSDTTLSKTATGNYYVDLADGKTTLNALPLRVGGRIAKAWADTSDGTHIHNYNGTSLTSQKRNGSSVSVFSVTSNSVNKIHQNNSEIDRVITESFGGSFASYAAGDVITLGVKVDWEGNLDQAVTTHCGTICNYEISIYLYNKAALASTLSSINTANYQEAQYLAAAPAGVNTDNFKSWSDFQTALRDAWVTYGKEDVTKAEINNANNALIACKPTYDSNGNWVSGMMPADADYQAIDLLIASLPTRFKNYTYSDHDPSNGRYSYGMYYKASVANAVNDALADIAYDRPLSSLYQGTVDTMKATLSGAIANLDGGYKDVDVVFATSATDVLNMPARTTATLFSTIQKPTDPSKTYYRFDGWFYDEDMTQKVTWPLGVTPGNEHFAANLSTKVENAGVAFTLYAKFTLTGKTLSFVTNGGSSMDPVTGNSGDPYAGPATKPTKAGYTFDEWYSDAALQHPVDWNTFTFGLYDVVYAKWNRASFTVTFNAVDGRFASTGSTTAEFTGLFGDRVERPESPTRSGYGFVGWCYDAALTQSVDFSTFTVPSENTTVYAKWSQAQRNITYVYGNGSEPLTVSYTIGTNVTAPTQPTRDGYNFDGWYSTSNYASNSKITFPYSVTDNVTFYAKWNPLKFKVFFDAGEGTMAPSFNASFYENGLDCGTVLTPPENPTREGYVFVGWTEAGSLYTFTTVPARDLYLVASWDVEPPTAHIRLRTDKTGTVSQGDVINATVSIRTNYITGSAMFIVYYDNRYLQPAKNGEPYTAAVANYTACSRTPGSAYFTVVQNPGVTNVTDTASDTTLSGRVNVSSLGGLQNYYPPEWLDVTVIGTKNTYTLKSQYANMDYVWFTATETSTGTHATPVEEQDIATFQFMVKDNAPLANGTTSYAQLLIPSNFVKTSSASADKGKTFCVRKGLIEYDRNDITDYEIAYDLQNNDVRFAVAQMQTVTVSFDTQGGSSVASRTEKVGRTIQLETPEKANYSFLGWTTTPTGTDYVNADAYVVPSSNITLYAQWKGAPKTYYVYHYQRNLDNTAWILPPEIETLTADIGSTVTAEPKNYEGFIVTPAAPQVVPAEGELILKLYYSRMDVTIVLDAALGSFAGGTQTVTLRGQYGQQINNAYGDPSRTGYRFKGWLSGNTPYTLTTYPAVERLELRANWEAETYTLTFILDNVVYSTIQQKYGTAITAPSVSPGPNQVFSGWRNSATGELFNYTTMPAKNETFTGTLDADGYTLTLMVDGRQYGESVLYGKGAMITAAMVAYTPATGYSFNGWHTTKSITSPKVSFPMTLNANTTLYGFTAQKSYTLTMMVKVPEAIGGDGEFEELDSFSATYGANIEGWIEDPEFDGCGFNGWYLDDDLTNVFVKPDTMPAEDLVIYGELYVLQGTVEFDVNGGVGSVESMTAPIGDTITLPGASGVTKQYYRFGGWGASANATTPITSVAINDTSTVTVYAIWIRNYANVSYDLNGGSGTKPTTIKIEIGGTAPLPAGNGLTRDGFMFTGWSTVRNDTQPMTSCPITSATDVILYAVWAPLSVSMLAQTGSTTVIDNEKGFIYGLGFDLTETSLLNDYLTVDGNGTIQVLSSNYIGTGTVVQLINNYTGNVDATYQLVIFGDVTGDGVIDGSDIRATKGHISGASEFAAGSAQLFAADVTGDGEVMADDTIRMKGMISGAVDLDQATRRTV